MTDTSIGPPDDADSAAPAVDADKHLRQTSSKILFGAAAVAAIAGVVGLVNGSNGTGGLIALVLAATLSWLGYRRAGDDFGTDGLRKPAAVSGSVSVTAEDLAKARSLVDDELSIEDICRLTRGGYSWWSETDQSSFRDELSRRLAE